MASSTQTAGGGDTRLTKTTHTLSSFPQWPSMPLCTAPWCRAPAYRTALVPKVTFSPLDPLKRRVWCLKPGRPATWWIKQKDIGKQKKASLQVCVDTYLKSERTTHPINHCLWSLSNKYQLLELNLVVMLFLPFRLYFPHLAAWNKRLVLSELFYQQFFLPAMLSHYRKIIRY